MQPVDEQIGTASLLASDPFGLEVELRPLLGHDRPHLLQVSVGNPLHRLVHDRAYARRRRHHGVAAECRDDPVETALLVGLHLRGRDPRTRDREVAQRRIGGDGRHSVPFGGVRTRDPLAGEDGELRSGDSPHGFGGCRGEGASVPCDQASQGERMLRRGMPLRRLGSGQEAEERTGSQIVVVHRSDQEPIART